MITKGHIPDGIRNRRSDISGAKGIEVYEKGRYLTITGNVLNGEPKPVSKLSNEFWSYYQGLGSETIGQQQSGHNSGSILTSKDQWIIDKLLKDEKVGSEFRKLYMYGDLSPYENDQSRGDLKLTGLISYYASFDESQIDRIFRASKLYRPK